MRALVARLDYKFVVAGVFVFGLFMYSLDTTIINVALPRLSVEFNAGTDKLEWVVTGYLLSLAVWVPASGWIGDRYGTKRTFLFATATFVIASALCGRAWSIESLTAFRVLQGVGGGMMTPVGTAMLFRAYTIQERARAAAIMGIPTQIAPMLGPVLGGFLVDKITWRWIFYVNLPVGAISFVWALFGLKEHKEPRTGGFDPAGFFLSGAGLAGLLYALSRGPDDGWTNGLVLVAALGGLLSFGLLVVAEHRNSEPMLDLMLFQSRMFRTANLLAFAMFAAQNGILFLIPLFLQGLRGLSALDSGLVTFLQPVGTILMVQITSRTYNRLGPRRNLICSTSGVVITSVLLMLVDLNTNLWLIRGIMFLRGTFLAFNMVAVQTTAFATISREKMGRASSLFSAQRQVAAAFGVAALGTVLISMTHASVVSSFRAAAQADLPAFHVAFAGAGILGLIALFFALNIHDQDAPAFRRPLAAEQSQPEARQARTA